MARTRIPKNMRVPKVTRPKSKSCIACNGSGRYDHNGSPPCGACGGTGIEEQNHD